MLISPDSVKIEYRKLYDLSQSLIYFPIFQRGFSWKPVQTEKILEDIETAIYQKDKQIYLLDFIWFTEEEKFKLADGQQRLITVFILIKCINETIETHHLPITPIKNFSIVYDDNGNNVKFQKLCHNDIVSPFKKVYLSTRTFIEKHKEDIPAIIETITQKFYVYLKDAQNPDDAFEIFQQINTGGKPLSKDEIIKTIISQYAQKYGITIISPLKDIKKLLISYYKYTNQNPQGNFDSIGIMSFLNKQIVCDKKHFDKFVSYLKAVEKINELAIYHVVSYLNRNQILDIIYILGICGIDLSKDTRYVTRVLLPLCLLSSIMTIKKANPGGIILTLYSAIISMVKNGEKIDEIEKFILDFIDQNKQICKISLQEFTDGIGSCDLSIGVKKALLIMDIIQSNKSGSLNVERINVEHIYPKKPATSWALNGWPANSADSNVLINNIGNLFLLNEQINKRLQNKYITEKVVSYNAIIPKDTFLQTPMNTVDFYDFEKRRGEYIIERQASIAKKIQDGFVFGKVLITN